MGVVKVILDAHPPAKDCINVARQTPMDVAVMAAVAEQVLALLQ